MILKFFSQTLFRLPYLLFIGYVGSLYGAGWGGWGAGYAGYAGHGVAVRGPHTVPAVVAGPAGKIVADGLYGVPHHHY